MIIAVDAGFWSKLDLCADNGGCEQKSREGKWNGGFAPYGYKLINRLLKTVMELRKRKGPN